MRFRIFSLVIILMAISRPGIAEILVVNKGYLYVPRSENRRLLLDPGALLLKKEIPQEEVYRKRIRVITRGGIEGEVRRRNVDALELMEGSIAYVKKTKKIDGQEFHIGTIFPVRLEEDDEGDFYHVAYAKSFYSIKHKDFGIRKKEQKFSESEFFQHFNVIDPSEARKILFPCWKLRESQKATEWGCGDSKTETTEVSIGAGAGIKAGGGFFRFFQAEAEVRNDNKKTITYTSELKDDEFRHKIRYFSLKKSLENNETILNIALEKLSLCNKSKGVKNSYVIRFEKKLNFGELIFNEGWAQDNGFARGLGSPVRLDNLSDSERFKQAFKGFKFHHPAVGYDVELAVREFAIQYAVNLDMFGN